MQKGISQKLSGPDCKTYFPGSSGLGFHRKDKRVPPDPGGRYVLIQDNRIVSVVIRNYSLHKLYKKINVNLRIIWNQI